MSTSDSLAKQDGLKRSRAFLLGESVFTSLRVVAGKPLFLPLHFERLRQSAEWLWPETSSQLDELFQTISFPEGDGVLRLTLFAMQEGRQLRPSDIPLLHLDQQFWAGLPVRETPRARLVKCPPRPSEWPSFLKTGDYLARLVAARHLAAEEIPLFHVGDTVTEFIHANLLLWDGGSFITPKPGADTLDGVGLRRFRSLCRHLGIRLLEREVHVTEVKKYRTAFALNAVRGLVPVRALDECELVAHPLELKLTEAFFHEAIDE